MSEDFGWPDDEIPVDPADLDNVDADEIVHVRDEEDFPHVEPAEDIFEPPSLDSGGAGESTESQILGNADEM